jgi:hypothetical protein
MNKELVAPITVATALVVYRNSKNGTSINNPIPHVPLPSELASVFLVFGTLSLLSGRAAKPALLTAWGLNVAILLNLWSPGSSVIKVEKATTPQVKNVVATKTGVKNV